MTAYLHAAFLWWAGRSRAGEALRVGDDGRAVPVPLADVPPGAPQRRLPGTLLPGLTDAHVHSGLVDLATVRSGGIATVWDLGSAPARVADLARAADLAPAACPARAADLARRPRLPRIRYAGPFLTAPGGYPSDRGWAARGSWREIGTAADAGAAVAETHAAGASLIKVCLHAGGPLPGRETLAAVVGAAHARSLPVVVHAEGPGTVAVACEAGADMLAHTPWTEPLDEALVRACAARMQWISTLDIHGWGAPTAAQRTAIDNLRRFRQHGGRVRYGTDLGNGPLPPGVNPREIRALQTAGLSPADILLAMTGDGVTGDDVTRDGPTEHGPTGNGPTGDSGTGDGVTWIPGGLDLAPARFAGVLATARVLDGTVRPR